MKKLLIILSVLVFLMLPFTAYAAIIPEDNLIGETVLIEPDGNFIKDNIKNGNPDDTGPEETAQILSLDRDGYVKKIHSSLSVPHLRGFCGLRYRFRNIRNHLKEEKSLNTDSKAPLHG